MIVPVIRGLLRKIDCEILVKVKLHGNSQLSFIGSLILVTGDLLFFCSPSLHLNHIFNKEM